MTSGSSDLPSAAWRCGTWSARRARSGSLDGAMREVSANPLAAYVARSAAAPRDRLQRPDRREDRARGDRRHARRLLIDLPTSSPAYTLAFADKAGAGGSALANFAQDATLGAMSEEISDADLADEDEDDNATGPMSLVDEALVAGNIANTNGLLVILAKLVAKGIFDAEDLQAFSDSYSKPLDHEHMRDNELVSQMQDQMEETLAQLMHFLVERP